MAVLSRVQATSRVTLSHTFYVDGQATDAGGPVTYTLKRLDGSAVASGTAVHGATGVYAYDFTAPALVDTNTLDWSGTVAGAAVTVRDFVETCGGFYFGLYDARNRNPKIPVADYSDAELGLRRTVVEDMADRLTGQAWVPRFKRRILDGTGTPDLMLPDLMVRTVRAVTVGGAVWSPSDVAAVLVGESGVASLVASVWPRGRRNVVIEYEHGHDYPAGELSDAAILHLRSRLALLNSNVPLRAISMTPTEGGFYRLDTAGPKKVGIADVDATYLGLRLDVGGFA